MMTTKKKENKRSELEATSLILKKELQYMDRGKCSEDIK
jgi:hypothetical protein